MVLGVDFQETDGRPVALDLRHIRHAQTDPGAVCHAFHPALSLPPTILSQVPLGTAIQASVWASFLDVPAQDEPAVWQSFLPALATPKHFSVMPWAWAATGAARAAASAAAMAIRVEVIGSSMR